MYKYLLSSRKLASVSQSELAELLEIQQSAYSMKENGKSRFSLQEAIKIHDYLIERLNEEDIIPFKKMFRVN